jgi:cell division protein FtsL
MVCLPASQQEEIMERVQNLTNAYSQAPWRKQLQFLGLFLLVVVFIGLVAGVYLSVTASAAKVGRDIQSMQSELEQYAQSNVNLQSQLGFLTSASEMEKRAHNMGFKPIDMDQAIYISVQNYTDRRPAILAPAPGRVVISAPALPDEYSETLFDWLDREVLQSPFPLINLKSLFEVKP